MKFLQITTHYYHYLAQLYRSRPLAAFPYEEQLSAVLADGVSAVHMFAGEMGRLGYESTAVIGNALSLQRQWALENGLPPPEGNDGMRAVVRLQVETFQPDVLYLQDPIVFDGRFLQSLNWMPRLVIAWRAASIPDTTDWRGIDILLSSDPGCRRIGMERGARRTLPFSPGFPVELAAAVGTPAPGPDLVFCGSLSPEHQARRHLLTELSRWARAQGASAAFHILGPGETPPSGLEEHARPQLFGLDMYRALGAARICINNHIDALGCRGQNMRVFEATGSGGLLMTEADPSLDELFVAEKEVATYAGMDALFEAMRWYLDHPRARDDVAKRGQDRCLRDHSRARRAAMLDELIRSALG